MKIVFFLLLVMLVTVKSKTEYPPYQFDFSEKFTQKGGAEREFHLSVTEDFS